MTYLTFIFTHSCIAVDRFLVTAIALLIQAINMELVEQQETLIKEHRNMSRKLETVDSNHFIQSKKMMDLEKVYTQNIGTTTVCIHLLAFVPN